MKNLIWSNKYCIPNTMNLSELKNKLDIQLDDEIIGFADFNIKNNQYYAFTSIGKNLSNCFECIKSTYSTYYIDENNDFYLSTSNLVSGNQEKIIRFRKWKSTTSEFDRYRFKNYLWQYSIIETDIDDYTEPIGLYIQTLIQGTYIHK